MTKYNPTQVTQVLTPFSTNLNDARSSGEAHQYVVFFTRSETDKGRRRCRHEKVHSTFCDPTDPICTANFGKGKQPYYTILSPLNGEQ